MPAVHELGEWVGGAPNLLSLPVTTFHPTCSSEAQLAQRMLETKSPELWEHRKRMSIQWAMEAVATYDMLWLKLCNLK